jgi:hypothetical protein
MMGEIISNQNMRILLCLLIWLSPALFDSGIKGERHPCRIQTANPVVLNGVSVPSDYPFIRITVNKNPDTGRIFLNTGWTSSPNYNMILDNSGAPVWYHRAEEIRQDLKLQPDGRMTQLIRGRENNLFIAMDSTYAVVDTFQAPSRYHTDEHDLKILPDGHYLLIADKDTLIDMSRIVPGGKPEAIVKNNYLIEMDANDKAVFIWNSLDYFNIQDVVDDAFDVDLTEKTIDYAHMNSMDVDLDGNFVVSSRNLCEITKIDRQTGEIIWRLGGEHDYFTWVNDEYRISCQHDIRVLPNGNFTVFDNGNYHQSPFSGNDNGYHILSSDSAYNDNPRFSRALELSVNTGNWTVTKVWEYREIPDHYSWLMGNVQRLPNGNTLINWAESHLPKLTEVRPDGSKAFELNFIDSHWSYRTFRFPWSGKAAVPYLLIEPHEDYITLLFNKFGDSDISEYRIYGGISPHPPARMATVTEPFVHLSNELQNNAINYFRVTAVNSQARESDFSNEEAVYVHFIPPGENLVINGDFSKGIDFWNWSISDNASADWSIDDGTFHFNINHGDADIDDINLIQKYICLISGKSYLFEFDAWADGGRVIEADVTSYDRRNNYSEIGATYITERKQHFTRSFDYKYPSDCGMIHIDAGASDIDFYIDNISLKEVIESDAGNWKADRPSGYRLQNSYPNPFNLSTTIRYAIPESSEVSLTICDQLGREITTLVNKIQTQGAYSVIWNGRGHSSGIYICRLRAGAFTQTIKLVLQK